MWLGSGMKDNHNHLLSTVRSEMIAVVVKLVFLVLTSTYSKTLVCGEVFYGAGQILYSHTWTSSDLGIEISYRPENYETCE